MRVDATRLATDGLVVELPNELGDPDRVELGRGAIKRGALLTSPEEIRLESLASDELTLSLLRLFLGGGRKLEASGLSLRGAAVDLRIARGALRGGRQRLVGALSCAELSAARLTLDLGDVSLSADALIGKGLFVQLGADGVRRIELATLEVSGAHLQLGETRVALESLSCRAIAATLAPASSELKAEALAAGSLALTAGASEVRARDVSLPRGVSYGPGGVGVERATLGELELSTSLARSARAAQAEPAGPGLDLRLLDQLHGFVHVDVTVDAKVPVIKRRVATHELRVRIDGGVIDFHELERDLSLLEDAILDFEFEGDRLILEKDLPLVPFDNQTLVYWLLDDEGKRLAASRRVRLRTLARPSLPEAPAKPASAKSSFELVRLDFDPLEAKLRLQGPGRFTLPGGAQLRVGEDERPGVAELVLKAALRHRADNPAEPGQVEARASDVCLGLEALAVGARSLSLAMLEIATLEAATLDLEGLAPRQLKAKLRQVALTRAALTG